MAKMELCYPEDNCLTQDTIIVLFYAVFCIVFGFVVALLVIWADKRKSKTISITNTDPANGNIEVSRCQKSAMSNLSPGCSESAEDGRGEGAGGGVQVSDQAGGRS